MARRKVTDGLTLLSSGLYERKITLKDGRRKAFRSKEPGDVWRKLEEFNENDEKGPLFKTVAELYYANKIENAKNGTARCYKAPYNYWLSEYAEQRISNIEPIDIKKSFNALALKGYARKTLVNRKIVLKGIFDIWITTEKWNGQANPVSLVELPKGLKTTRREPPSPAQINLVKQAIQAQPKSVGAIVAATFMYTGLRRGEGLALQICDIDFNKNIINVNKQVEHINNKPHIIETKTAAGVRQLPLLEPFSQVLKNVRNLPPNTYIFGCKQKPLTQTEYNTQWVNFCRSIELAESYITPETKIRDGKKTIINRTIWKATVTAHQFRHEFCSIMYEAGVPEEVAVRIMGHEDSQMIHKVYLHIREKSINEAATKLENYFMNGTPLAHQVKILTI